MCLIRLHFNTFILTIMKQIKLSSRFYRKASCLKSCFILNKIQVPIWNINVNDTSF